jgi:3-isopropylmalate/(R)-2-methylmalate dehydratase small subunit
LPCACASREDIRKLASALEANPQAEVVVDVAAQEVRCGKLRIKVSIREAARDALVNGRWDAIGELLEGVPAVQALAQKLPYLAA